MPRITRYTGELAHIFADTTSNLAIQLMIEKGIVKKYIPCDKCPDGKMELVKTKKTIDLHGYRCIDKFCENSTKNPISMRQNSFLKQFRFPCYLVIYLCHCWATQVSVRETVVASGLTRTVVMKFFQVSI